MGPGTGSQPLSTPSSEPVTKQASIRDWDPGWEAFRPKQVCPLEATGVTARPLPTA